MNRKHELQDVARCSAKGGSVDSHLLSRFPPIGGNILGLVWQDEFILGTSYVTELDIRIHLRGWEWAGFT